MRAYSAVATIVALSMLASTAVALPLPGLNGETTNMIPVVGRVFPEPLATNDYIGYKEAIAGLNFLNRTYPDRVEFIKIGKSVGWMNRLTNQRDPSDVFIVEVTNEKSAIPKEDKIQLLFMLSIHGNEKGGREGGLRVVEDFAKGNVGVAQEKPDLVKLLDYFLLVFLFSNADGWTHDEPEYYGPGGTMYTRGNANGVDMNRQWPTSGFMANDRSHRTVSEPEIKAATEYLKDHYKNIKYASDIHGMLNPADDKGAPTPVSPGGAGGQPRVNQNFPTQAQNWANNKDKGHFILGMLPAGQLSQVETARVTRLGELVRERLSAHEFTRAWTTSPSLGPWGGPNFVRWGAVWETIGYQVSGGSHDWFVSDRGLNAPSFSFEMSYNHIVCDAMYPGCGAAMNYFHVNAVRQIVATFMEAATKDFQVSFEANGHRTAYVVNPKVLTSEQDRAPEGWSAEYPGDDRWQYNQTPYRATTNDFFTDFAQFVREGDKPGVFDALNQADVKAEVLAKYDNLVIAGSAYEQIRGSGVHINAIDAWVKAGGNLVVTDTALGLAAELGLVPGDSVTSTQTYMGYTDVIELKHQLATDMIGFSRQTFEGVPLGYQHTQRGSPNWYIRADAVKAKGTVVGVVGDAAEGVAQSNPSQANYGVLNLGEGKVTFLGALLPDPTTEHYHPYGLVSYATTYAALVAVGHGVRTLCMSDLL
ncbi:MAG: hypothetical protein HYT80_10600 [Euryarchaeota archaeon]|nr:hypothetical protein [Euryarchaeota archaeon]